MAAQLRDKGHPALQTVPADRFAMLIDECAKQNQQPSESLVKLIAKGRQSLHKA